MTHASTSNGFGHFAGGQTRQLARFVTRLNYLQLPEEVVEEAKTCVLDALAAMFLGAALPWGKIMIEYANAVGGKAESTVIGGPARAPAGNAALANGTMGHGFEIDDALIPALHHPGVVVVPAALAVAEREGSTGKEFITAVVAGYEAMNRAGKAVGTESHIMRGFFPTGTNGPFGSAAAAGLLMRLDEARLVDAFGIAGCQSSGLFEGIKEGRMTKRFGAGRGAQAGVLAADLAKLGFTGPTTVLEGEWGYLKAFSDKGDPSPITEGLGQTYNIMETTFKPYSCCKALHAAIDGTLDLNREHHFHPEEIKEIVIGGYEKLVKMHDIYEPASSMASQFSIPYVVSVALLKGSPTVEDFSESRIRDKNVLDFARKVRTVIDPEIVPFFPANEPSKVTVVMKNGKTYSKTVIHSRGTPENPMSREELEAKFKTFASPLIPASQVEKAIDRIWKLEEVSNLNELIGKKGEGK